MSSLILDMQRKALDPKETLDIVVSYALTVAAKLGDEETQAWARHELNGYYNVAVPHYRIVESRLRAWNPVRREWMPVLIDSPDVMAMFSTSMINMPLSEIVTLATVKDSDTIQMDIDHHLFHRTFSKTEQYQRGLRPCQIIAKNSLIGILGVVRTRVLDWSLELEKRGVKGTDFEFSPQEKQAASHIVIQVNSGGILHQTLTQNSSNVAIAHDRSQASLDLG